MKGRFGWTKIFLALVALFGVLAPTGAGAVGYWLSANFPDNQGDNNIWVQGYNLSSGSYRLLPDSGSFYYGDADHRPMVWRDSGDTIHLIPTASENAVISIGFTQTVQFRTYGIFYNDYHEVEFAIGTITNGIPTPKYWLTLPANAEFIGFEADLILSPGTQAYFAVNALGNENDHTRLFADAETTAVPLPGSLLLLGPALAGLAVLRRQRKS